MQTLRYTAPWKCFFCHQLWIEYKQLAQMRRSALQTLSSWVRRNVPGYLILLKTSVAKTERHGQEHQASPKLTYLSHKCKKETRLKSYIGAYSNQALFITSNPEAKLSISNLPYLNSQLHFQRLPGVLPVLFSLSQRLALLTIIELRM